MRAKDADPRPARPLYAVGDIHGRADLLDALLQRIAADAAARGAPDAAMVFVGDYIDRGEGARAVLDLLCHMQRQAPGDAVCLMGNHERMMLDFLDDPEGRGGRWLRHGGVQTLTGFGIRDAPERPAPGQGAQLAARLRAAMPGGLEAWLRDLPLWHRSGDVVCVHAAMDPALGPAEQEARTMLWDRPRFRARPRRDGLWVVHGHSVVHAPVVARRHIAVDTGAWFSDRLTAAAIYPGAPVRFLQTGG